jgi:hypothetical protein
MVILPLMKICENGSGGAKHSRGAHAPSHVVFDALVENLVRSPATPIFGEGAKDHTRGRVCSPQDFRAALSLEEFPQIMMRGSIAGHMEWYYSKNGNHHPR